MNGQQDLFHRQQRVRETSAQAGRSIKKTTKEADRKKILHLLRHHEERGQGLTREQLAFCLDMKIQTVCPRVRELLDGGFIMENGKAKTASGRAAMVLRVKI